jgi:hypothetical protein
MVNAEMGTFLISAAVRGQPTCCSGNQECPHFSIAHRFVQMAAYNMVNPRVIQQERSLCSPNENPDVARELAVADQVAAVRGGTPKQVAQTKGMQDKTGGSMWVPF